MSDPGSTRNPEGANPGDRSRDPTPHHALNNPAQDPDPTEWPDPYDRRRDPRDTADAQEDPRDTADAQEETAGEAPHPATGTTSTSEPHPGQDPEAEPWEGPKRDKVDQ